MVEMIIKLEKKHAVETADGLCWNAALVNAAQVVAHLNQYSGTESFPNPIPVNPEAITCQDGVWTGNVEGVLGDVNTIPDAEGYTKVRINCYDVMDTTNFPAMPPFGMIFGKPPHVGEII